VNNPPSSTSPAPARLSPRRQWTLLAAVAALAVVLFVGLPLGGRLLAPKPPPPPAAPAPGTFQATDEQWATLGLQQAGASTITPGVQTDGKIAADEDLTTQVLPPVSGQVAQIFVKAGDPVRRGQPLFTVQSPDFAQAQGDLASALAQAKAAEANEARLHALYDGAGGSLKDWRQSQADLITAQSALRSAEGKLKAMGAGDANNGLATVRAPIDGVVTQRLIGVGQNIGSVSGGASSPAMVVSDLHKVWLTANVREADSGQMRIGQTLQVRVLAQPGRVYQAKVDYVGSSIDPATRRLAVRAVLDNADGSLKPEMFARFVVSTGPAQSAVVVPEAAVIFEGDTARVWVAHPAAKTLELRQIKAGDPVDGQVQALSGLKAGEWVVTSGSLFIDRASKPD
jgi:cobalt-zinc-cadmium efflux system membrane fusion protein